MLEPLAADESAGRFLVSYFDLFIYQYKDPFEWAAQDEKHSLSGHRIRLDNKQWTRAGAGMILHKL